MSRDDIFLLLDVGNTRVKWALTQPGPAHAGAAQWLAEGACTHDRIDGLLHEWAGLAVPDRVVGANVAGGQAVERIETCWRQRGVPLAWAQVQPACCGVTNTYDRPDQLGVDRWAALIGAWRRQQGPCLVVSAGTAMTIDTLDAHGNFQGGLILPGRRLMQTSLVAGTHALSMATGRATTTPRNTSDAIASGIAAALTAPVREAYARLAASGAAAPACVLTGGDAEWLSSQLEIGCTIAPSLVQIVHGLILEGLLEMALEENRI